MRCATGTSEGPQVVVDGRTPSHEEVMSTARHGGRVVLADEAAQAVDLAAPTVLGRGPEFLRRSIREVVPRLDDDRPCGVDVETVCRDILESDDVRSTLRALTGEASALVGGAA
ncbi:hypothetical protein ACSCB1_32580 [Streptomyces europaeiscabiei]|uniref:Uncharacterized protein n=1 Tax=Streptomyces europaeiscabiei TaxID=146819 RepID=A0ABU4NNF0_9ACTN|nr:hypothetical protein [Streptomyces europaeiscabiei]MDX2529026.1 hypothetical protein [Streptomyces europaeiscabiei]MDX2759055.1 hypothetical protein [Streptomyces europaeiscabiei]MDX2767237.1 hypothetical protein [Streptomyces europaeiscabiei]MDX3546666.1 hypothetical protein [Streptomyces europaeiscabiei]MDX3556360.1 hypothetical protein [Streptomyces europaeiscabiei]